MNVKKIVGILLAVTALTIGTSSTAFAAAHNSSDHYGETGRCSATNGVACLYYNSGEAGAIFHMQQPIAISNLSGYTFDSSGTGAGQSVKNNAASVENALVLGCELDVFYSSNYGGDEDYLQDGSYGQLYYTYNEDASIADICP